MAKTAKDYPVTFPFGATTVPYSASHPHMGEDRAMPTGTRIEVNGTLIGLSGSTGLSTGPHLHIQKRTSTGVVSPSGGGFNLSLPAKVSATGSSSTIGNYVRIKDSKGVEWSYFHQSQVKVKAGDSIGKEEMATLSVHDVAREVFCHWGRNATQAEKDAYSKVEAGEMRKRISDDAQTDKWIAQVEALKQDAKPLTQGKYIVS